MRYHWGLGVGHFHAHRHAALPGHNQEDPENILSPEPDHEEAVSENNYEAPTQDENSDLDDAENPELGLEDRNFEGWEDVESEDVESEDSEDAVRDSDIEEEGDLTGM